mgnify:CR=1 FL=1|jgi:ribosome maturation factor RimP
MINRELIENIVNEKLVNTDKFLVDVEITPTNKISVFIDGDNGIKISDCVEVSRFIEKKLENSEEVFELNVSSPGINNSLLIKRQYKKNIGRKILVSLEDKTQITGKLIEVSEDNIVLELEMPKKTNKKQQSEFEAQKVINFNNIKEAKVIISFK